MEQKLWMWICSTLFFITICNCASRNVPSTQFISCIYYNQTACEHSGGKYGCGNETQNCTASENDKPSYCYAVWQNDTKTNLLDIKLKVLNKILYDEELSKRMLYLFNVYFFLQGCFLNNVECHGQKQCKEKKGEIKPNQHLFCCCEGDFCNTELLWDPIPTTPRIEPCK